MSEQNAEIELMVHRPISVYEMPDESAEALLQRIDNGTAVLAFRVCAACAPPDVLERIEEGTLDLSDGDALDAQWPCAKVEHTEIEPRRWEVRRGDRFLPYQATVWMNEHDYGFHYTVLDHAATTLPRAIKRGLAMAGHDDFNIAAIRDGRMVAVLWMEEITDDDPEVIDRVADALGVNQ